jgi:broad specificity phosphatase PhoE
MKNNLNKFIFIVRHAERADMVEGIDLDILKCGKYDTELTEYGKLDAVKVGEKIKNFLHSQNKKSHINFFEKDKENYLKNLESKKKITLICSPFARTLMTANSIIKGLNLQLPIKVEKGLCEHLSEKWYPEHPEKFLLSIKKENDPCKKKEFLHSQISDRKIIHENITHLPKYPETHEECHIRFKRVYESLLDHYMNKLDNEVLIMVTHFFPVEIFVKCYHDEECILPVEYCITLAFNYDDKKKKPIYIDKIYPEDFVNKNKF